MSDLAKQLQKLQQKVEKLLRKGSKQQEQNDSSNYSEEERFKKFARDFKSNSNNVRSAFLENLTPKQREWLERFNKFMKHADNLSQPGVEFFQEFNLAFETKRFFATKDSTRPVDENRAALLEIKAMVSGIIMVGDPLIYFIKYKNKRSRTRYTSSYRRSSLWASRTPAATRFVRRLPLNRLWRPQNFCSHTFTDPTPWIPRLTMTLMVQPDFS